MEKPLNQETAPHVLLVGAGHAHLWVAAHARRLVRRGARVTLVAPGPTWYSGMATGVLGGRYAPEADQIDPALAAERGGARFVAERVTSVDTDARVAHLGSGDRLPYDFVSFCVGSTVEPFVGAETHPAVWPVKPIPGLAQLRAVLERRLGAHETTRIVVIGAGATGCELAANLLALGRRYRHRPAITLVGRDHSILPEGPAGASAALDADLRRRGVRIFSGRTAEAIEPEGVRVDGELVAAHHVVLATGLRAHPLVGALGLPADPADGLRVDAQLRSIADPRVHAVGDCAAFEPRPLPRVGVFGVRQAPVLLDNLCAAIAGRPGRPFRPQRRWLAILNLGDGRGLALWGRYWTMGWWAMHIKERLDRGFVNAFR